MTCDALKKLTDGDKRTYRGERERIKSILVLSVGYIGLYPSI